MNVKKITLGVLISAIFITVVFFTSIFKVTPKTNAPTSEQTELQNDPIQKLKDANASYRTGIELSRQGKMQEAISSFEEAKALSTSNHEKSTIDFNIALTKFDLTRTDGIDAFVALSKNETYPDRTRALAMTRAFLLYSKYSDVKLLQKLASNYDIPWTIPEEVTYQYMKKINDLYPFPIARIRMIDYELNQITDGPVAKQLYEANLNSITAGIENLKESSGEQTELTSSMLAHARLLDRLALQYGVVTFSEVETAYQTLIDYDNARDLTTNKQYALLYYANFLSGAGDFKKAVSMLDLILGNIDPALAEALPRLDAGVRLPHLVFILENTDKTEISNFIKSIGSKLQ